MNTMTHTEGILFFELSTTGYTDTYQQIVVSHIVAYDIYAEIDKSRLQDETFSFRFYLTGGHVIFIDGCDRKLIKEYKTELDAAIADSLSPLKQIAYAMKDGLVCYNGSL